MYSGYFCTSLKFVIVGPVLNTPRKNFFVCLSLFIAIVSGSRADSLNLVTVENSADTFSSEAVLTTAYKKLGIDILIKRYPAERALRMAAAGQVDGEVQRIDAVGHDYPSLIQIRPAINYLEAVVFTRNTEFEPSDWQSLEPYRIGLIRGIKFAENNTRHMNRHRVNTYHSLFTMLEKGRLEVAIAPRINGLAHIRHSGIQNIRELAPPIDRFDLYHYLHTKNQHLVEPISQILKQMEATGEIEQIRRHVNQGVLEQNPSKAAGGSDASISNDSNLMPPQSTESQIH